MVTIVLRLTLTWLEWMWIRKHYKNLTYSHKKGVLNVFFNDLEEKKLKHTKVKNIDYDGKRNPQPYLLNSNLNNKLSSLLFNLRCKSVNTFSDNFHSLYGKDPFCRLCMKFRDSQKHALVCDVMKKELTQKELEDLNKTDYFHLFSNIEAQHNITKNFK